MNAKFLNPSNYFSAAELEAYAIEGRDPTFKILGVKMEDVEDANNKTKKKGSLTLDGAEKPWLCNVTNTKCLVAMFGDETDAWIGKRVTLHFERVMAFGEWTLGVRITGSPDIAQPVSVRIKLRKKREQVLTMKVTARAPQPSPPKPTGANGKPPTPYDAMWKSFKAAGRSDAKEFTGFVRDFTGKTKPAEMTAADVLKFDSDLAALLAPNDAPPLEDGPPN